MPSNRPTIMIRTNDTIIKKFKVICTDQNRSMSNLAETLIIKCIKTYEAEHGEIKIEEEQP